MTRKPRNDWLIKERLIRFGVKNSKDAAVKRDRNLKKVNFEFLGRGETFQATTVLRDHSTRIRDFVYTFP